MWFAQRRGGAEIQGSSSHLSAFYVHEPINHIDSPDDDYLAKQDDLIFAALSNYFTAANDISWRSAPADSYIKKTVGVQALFDLSRPLLFEALGGKDIRTARFEQRMAAAGKIDFSDNFFQASGTGKQRIRTGLSYCLSLVKKEDLKPADVGDIARLCAR